MIFRRSKTGCTTGPCATRSLIASLHLAYDTSSRPSSVPQELRWLSIARRGRKYHSSGSTYSGGLMSSVSYFSKYADLLLIMLASLPSNYPHRHSCSVLVSVSMYVSSFELTGYTRLMLLQGTNNIFLSQPPPIGYGFDQLKIAGCYATPVVVYIFMLFVDIHSRCEFRSQWCSEN